VLRVQLPDATERGGAVGADVGALETKLAVAPGANCVVVALAEVTVEPDLAVTWHQLLGCVAGCAGVDQRDPHRQELIGCGSVVVTVKAFYSK